MLNVTKELTALARKLGYTGKTPDTVAKAINAITSVAGEGGGSGCDCEPGYEVVETQLFSETVTTAPGQMGANGQMGNSAALAYAETITAPKLFVTFDGTDYVCPAIDFDNGMYAYGGMDKAGPDFTEYPFLIVPLDDNTLFTETAGNHTIAASAQDIDTGDDFKNAVESVTGILPVKLESGVSTADEILQYAQEGRMMWFVTPKWAYTCFVTKYDYNTSVEFLTDSEVAQYITTSFVNGIFTVTEGE